MRKAWEFFFFIVVALSHDFSSIIPYALSSDG
jgi:hypothetical protein